MPKSWDKIEDPVVPLERNLCGHPLAGLVWERPFEKALLELGWEKSTELGMSYCSSKTRTILIGIRGLTSNWLEESRIWPPCGRN